MTVRLPLVVLLLFLFPAAGTAAADVKPINLAVNTEADEDDPHVSSGGLRLFYSSNANKKYDILLSRRANLSQPWGTGKMLDDYVPTKGDDRSVFTTTDGRYPQFLYYATKKDKMNDNFDLFVAVRHGADRGFTAPTPLNTVCTEADEMHPWLSADGLSLYFSRKTKDGWRVMVATRKSAGVAAGFGEPAPVKELPAGFHHATLTRDGKTMYLQGPLEKGRWGLFRSVRGPAGWGKPEPLENLNNADGPKGDLSPSLSRDGTHLYFASDRPGGKGGLDLWMVPTSQLRK